MRERNCSGRGSERLTLTEGWAVDQDTDVWKHRGAVYVCISSALYREAGALT